MTEENMGISRVQSSLELLSYTASLKNEIDKVQGDFPPARVSPAGRNILVHHMDAGGMASNAASSTAIAHGPSYSIEGYPLSTLEKSASYEEASSIGSPVPYFGHDNNRSAFEARRPTLAIKQPESSLSLSSLASGHHFGSANGFMRREETFASLQDLTSRISPSTDSLVVDAVSRATGSTKAYAQLEAENAELRQLLADKEEVIASLQDTVDSLQHKVADLRQLPTGKISQIPIE